MLIVVNFLSLFMVIFDLGVKANMVEGEIRLGFVFDSGFESFPYWSKTDDGSNIKKRMSYHPTWKLKCVGWRFPKTKGNYEHVGIIHLASSRQLDQVKNALIFPDLSFLLMYSIYQMDVGFTIGRRRRAENTIGLFHEP